MRKRQAKKRKLIPDPKFQDELVSRFVNMLMWSGKKSVALDIFYTALEVVVRKSFEQRSPSHGSGKQEERFRDLRRTSRI